MYLLEMQHNLLCELPRRKIIDTDINQEKEQTEIPKVTSSGMRLLKAFIRGMRIVYYYLNN